MIRALVLQSEGHEFKSFADDWLDLLPVVPGSNPKLLVKQPTCLSRIRWHSLVTLSYLAGSFVSVIFPAPKALILILS